MTLDELALLPEDQLLARLGCLDVFELVRRGAQKLYVQQTNSPAVKNEDPFGR